MPLFWKSKRGGLGGGRTRMLLWNLGILGLEVCRFVSVVRLRSWAGLGMARDLRLLCRFRGFAEVQGFHVIRFRVLGFTV